MKTGYETPAAIERRSMEIIEEELETMGIRLSGEEAPVIRRVIHASADFDYAKNLVFSERCLPRAKEALGRGCTVVTDTRMALSGISAPSLEALGCGAVCYVADPEVARAARERGTTRAVAAMERAAAEHPGAAFVVGNAPTALLCLADAVDAGIRPSLVVGVPVGFVNVTEGKERIIEACGRADVPCIVSLGRKGGSTIAAAIVNALLYEALGVTDPERRQDLPPRRGH